MEEMEAIIRLIRRWKRGTKRSTKESSSSSLWRTTNATCQYYTYTVAMEQLDQYFTPQVKVPYERHLFRTVAQLPTQSVDQFITRLRKRAEYCEFGNAKDDNNRLSKNVCPVVCEGNFWRKE